MSETTTQHPPQSSPAPAPNAYFRTRVMTSSPEQLRLLLLEGAVRFTRQGRDALVVKDHEGIFNGFSRARDIVVELMTSIRPDAEADLKSKVQGLYAFIFKLLVDASFEKDVDKAEKAAELLEYECETWRMALQKIAANRSTSAAPTPNMSSERPTLSLQA